MWYTMCIAIDCEMVGGPRGENMAARVTLVDEKNKVVLDEFIKPSKAVADYRYSVTGITARDLESAASLDQIRPKVEQAIDGRILVGHSLDADLDALGIEHPDHMKRDLALHKPFRNMNGGQPASLKYLANRILGRNIQTGHHSSKEDAEAVMDIYKASRF